MIKKPNDYIIRYFGKTGRKNAVDVLFEIMKKHPIEAKKNDFYPITKALARLADKHSDLINEQIDSLLRSEDERLTKLGFELRDRITHILHNNTF